MAEKLTFSRHKIVRRSMRGGDLYGGKEVLGTAKGGGQIRVNCLPPLPWGGTCGFWKRQVLDRRNSTVLTNPVAIPYLEDILILCGKQKQPPPHGLWGWGAFEHRGGNDDENTGKMHTLQAWQVVRASVVHKTSYFICNSAKTGARY